MGKRIGTRIVRAVRTLVLTGLLALALPSLASASNLYVTNYESDTVSVIDGTSNRVIATIPTGSETGPFSIAITPDGRTAWVGNFDSGTVISIDTATNQVVGAPIPIRPKSFAMAITPDGSRAYIANHEDDSVTAIELATRQVIGTPIQVCDAPTSLTISPDGRTLFVVCQGSGGKR